MDDYTSRVQEAETLRKSGKVEQATQYFQALWEQRPNARVGAGWIYCLRKQEILAEAIAVAQTVAARFPEDEWVNSEFAWCLYYHELKPAIDHNDLGKAVHFAKKIRSLRASELIIKRVTFEMIKFFKGKGDWELVLQWCSFIEPDALSSDRGGIGSHEIMSALEQWYYAKLKAQVNLQQWEQALSTAFAAVSAFPKNDDFQRWKAQARDGTGDRAGAIEDLEALLKHRGSSTKWYILQDLATLKHQTGNLEAAIRIGSKAALAPGEDKAKVNLFLFLAKLGLGMKNIEFAQANLLLAKLVRSREGWPIPPELAQLEQKCLQIASLSPELAAMSPQQLLNFCARLWRMSSRIGQERFTGRICALPEGKKFAFISPDSGGDDLFVPLSALPPNCRVMGARVEYAVETSFDAKKNRDALKAIDVAAIT